MEDAGGEPLEDTVLLCAPPDDETSSPNLSGDDSKPDSWPENLEETTSHESPAKHEGIGIR
jgi:hypothetical protein